MDSVSRAGLSLTRVGVREDGAEGWILDKNSPSLSSLLPLSTPTPPPSETKLISQIDEDRPGREKPRCVSYISNSRGSSQIGRRLKGKIVGVDRKISGLRLSPGPACLAPDTEMMSPLSVAGQPPRIIPRRVTAAPGLQPLNK